MHPLIEVLQIGVDELRRRHERIADLRCRNRTDDEDDEMRLLYDRTMPLLDRTKQRDLLALARTAERVIGRYVAWREDPMCEFIIELRSTWRTT